MEVYPELVRTPELDRYLANAEVCCRGHMRVSCLQIQISSSPEWIPHVDRAMLLTLLDEIRMESLRSLDDNRHTVTVFFLEGDKLKGTSHQHLDPDILRLFRDNSKLSSKLLLEAYAFEDGKRREQSSTAEFIQTFGSEEQRLQNSTSLIFDYGFWSYDKNENAWISCVECVTTAKNTIYYCINAGEGFVEHIVKTTLSKPFLAPRIFYIDALIADENIRQVKSVLGTEVYKLWHIEKNQDQSTIESQTKSLHNISASLTIQARYLVEITRRVDQLLTLYERHVQGQDIPFTGNPDSKGCDQSLRKLKSYCKSLTLRIEMTQTRTGDRINLLHHLATQQDNRLSQSTNNLMMQAVLLTQRDGASMFTLAAVATVFLPSSFITSVLSTVFFNYNGKAFTVSPLVWILPTVSIPLTLGVLAIWLSWFRWRLNREEEKLKELKVNSRGS